MNIYFEINDAVRDMYPERYPGKYCVKRGCTHFKQYYRTLLLSDRAWSADGDNVAFIKNRFGWPELTEEDETEFFWVILQSHVI